MPQMMPKTPPYTLQQVCPSLQHAYATLEWFQSPANDMGCLLIEDCSYQAGLPLQAAASLRLWTSWWN